MSRSSARASRKSVPGDAPGSSDRKTIVSARSSDGLASDAAVARIRAQLDHGAPWDACETFREARAQYANDAEFLYWGALAHARAGAAHEAHALLDRAQAAGGAEERLVDILSLRGRLWKDA